MYSSGTVTLTLMIGSRITGWHLFFISLTASEAAILNAISEESTSWYDPSWSVALTSTIGYPAKTPPARASCKPLSVTGMYSLGTTPPTTASTNSYPLPGFGSKLTQTCPYCPLPPDCLMYLPSQSPAAWIVSL